MATSGTQSTGTLTNTTDYALTCTGRWLRHAIGHRRGPGLGTRGDAQRQSKYRELRQRRKARLVQSQYHLMFRHGLHGPAARPANSRS